MAGNLDIIYSFRDREGWRVRNSLDSLAGQTRKDFSVLFIDYGSEVKKADEVREICQRYPFVTYHYINTRGMMWNRADALNHGLSRSKAEFVFTSDIDMVFYPQFVETLTRLQDRTRVLFFPVGYLKEADTGKVSGTTVTKLPFSKSKDFALGMLLAAKELIKSVNGYNSFFCLWGIEDNDLKLRIEKAGHSTDYYPEVLMLHQYHGAGPHQSAIPPGWTQFMKDYQNNYMVSPAGFSGLQEIQANISRPALAIAENSTTTFLRINSRKLFIRHWLLHQLITNGRLTLCVEMSADGEGRSLVISAIRRLNSLFRMLRFPVTTNSAFSEQRVTLTGIREEVLFMIVSLKGYYSDYYFTETGNSLRLVLVK